VRFGYAWEKYHALFPDYEDQFLRWIEPLGPSAFKEKSVLDAGCGMGRNSYWCLKYEASEVTAFDYDERCVDAASRFSLREYSIHNNRNMSWTVVGTK
jgi:ribosomal protein L11 methylase PrmA